MDETPSEEPLPNLPGASPGVQPANPYVVENPPEAETLHAPGKSDET